MTKYKAWLNLHGSKQDLGVNHFETYVPVTTWMAICFLLIVAILNHWPLRQVDFVMVCTQTPIECGMNVTLLENQHKKMNVMFWNQTRVKLTTHDHFLP